MKDRWLTDACLNETTVTYGGHNIYCSRKDLVRGNQIWQTERSKNWWEKNAYPSLLSIITDKQNTENHFFTSMTQGYIRQYDVRANTNGKAVLELQLSNTLNHPEIHHEESFNRIQQIGNTPQLICSGNRGSICVLDSRKFLTLQEYTKYAPEARPDKKPVVKSYAMLDYRHNNLLTHDFINPTKARPGLLATSGSDGNIRIYDARTEITKDVMFLNAKVSFLQFVPGSTCFSHEKEYDRLVKSGEITASVQSSSSSSSTSLPVDSDNKQPSTSSGAGTKRKIDNSANLKLIKEYEKEKVAQIAAKKKKLPPKNVNYRPEAQRNTENVKITDLFHGGEAFRDKYGNSYY